MSYQYDNSDLGANGKRLIVFAQYYGSPRMCSFSEDVCELSNQAHKPFLTTPNHTIAINMNEAQ